MFTSVIEWATEQFRKQLASVTAATDGHTEQHFDYRNV